MNTFVKFVGGTLAVILLIPLLILVLGAIGAGVGMLVSMIWPGVVGAFMTLFPSTIQFWHLTALLSIFSAHRFTGNIK